VVLKPNACATEAELIKFLSFGAWPTLQVPARSFEFVTGLPKTATRKILKKDLRKKYWQGADTMRPDFVRERAAPDSVFLRRNSFRLSSDSLMRRSFLHGLKPNR